MGALNISAKIVVCKVSFYQSLYELSLCFRYTNTYILYFIFVKGKQRNIHLTPINTELINTFGSRKESIKLLCCVNTSIIYLKTCSLGSQEICGQFLTWSQPSLEFEKLLLIMLHHKNPRKLQFYKDQFKIFGLKVQSMNAIQSHILYEMYFASPLQNTGPICYES